MSGGSLVVTSVNEFDRGTPDRARPSILCGTLTGLLRALTGWGSGKPLQLLPKSNFKTVEVILG